LGSGSHRTEAPPEQGGISRRERKVEVASLGPSSAFCQKSSISRSRPVCYFEASRPVALLRKYSKTATTTATENTK